MIVLLFGASGSAGGSVLKACLAAPDVTEVRAIVRRPLAVTHPKLRAYTHDDFASFERSATTFDEVDACLYCLGVSAVQVRDEAQYRRITQDFAMAAARTLKARSPGAAFHFISGRSTALDSRFMWARVKAETERDLMQLVAAVCWRPAAIDGEPSQTLTWYSPFRPLFKLLAPLRSLYVSGADLGRAMLQATREKLRGRILENVDIRDLADRSL